MDLKIYTFKYLLNLHLICLRLLTFPLLLDCCVASKKKKFALIITNLWWKILKEVMIRSRLRSKYSKNRTCEDWSNYKKQRDICKKILNKTKTFRFRNIDVKSITDNKRFSISVKPFFLQTNPDHVTDLKRAGEWTKTNFETKTSLLKSLLKIQLQML